MDEENKVEETIVQESISEELKYPLDKLRESSKELFGVSMAVFDGALYGHSGEFSKEEIKKIIEAWLETPIDKE